MTDTAVETPTEEALAAALAPRLEKAGARIRSLKREAIGTGQMAMVARCDLTYTAETDAPGTIIAKVPSLSPESRAMGGMGAYRREVVFYRDLAPRLRIRTPYCFHADIAHDDVAFLLLLEDMAPAEQGDQLAGTTPAIAERAVQELVGLHAPTWNDHDLFTSSEDLTQTQTKKDELRALYQACLPPFLDRYKDLLDADQVAVFHALGEARSPYWSLDMPVLAITHGDYRLDNLLIDTASKRPVTVVDWQTYTVGNPLCDVAYCLATSLSIEERRRHEADIIASYHAGLVAAGVEGFSADDCWREYRRCAMAGFWITAIATVSVERTERGDAMFALMADHNSRLAIDLGAQEFLS